MGDTIVVRARDNYVALASGTRVGRYVVRSVLGQGSFGITYLAHDGQLGCDVAIKEYLPMALAVRHDGLNVVPNSTKVAAEFAWGRERFIDEGHTLAGFRGRPGMVHVYDLVEDNGTAYIVMELVHGSTLADKLDRDGPLSAQDVDRLLPPLLDVLATVHQAGFVHRDIKPANILLDREGRPILIDFGAARAAMAARTTAMTAVFTPGYAAVEQFVEGNQGPWTDIYGLAATFYRAISSRLPPRSVERALEDKYQPLAELKPAGFPVQLLSGIDRGLAVRPADRPQTIEQWRAALFSVHAPAAAAPAPLLRRLLRQRWTDDGERSCMQASARWRWGWPQPERSCSCGRPSLPHGFRKPGRLAGGGGRSRNGPARAADRPFRMASGSLGRGVKADWSAQCRASAKTANGGGRGKLRQLPGRKPRRRRGPKLPCLEPRRRTLRQPTPPTSAATMRLCCSS